MPVNRYGVDIEVFSPAVRTRRRDSERASLGISATHFCVLMIGNDWKNKGLGTLLEVLGNCYEIGFTLVVVGSDDRRCFDEHIRRLRLNQIFDFLARPRMWCGSTRPLTLMLLLR